MLDTSKIVAPQGKAVAPLEAGNYLARVVQVVDMGIQQQRPYEGKEKPDAPVVRLTYELVTEFMEDEDGNEDKDRPLWVSEDFVVYPISQGMAKCTKRIKSIDPKLTSGANIGKLLGMPCTVTVVQSNPKNGRVYNNVGNVTPAMKGILVPELVNEAKLFDLSNPDMELYAELPQFIRDKIVIETQPEEASADGEQDSPY